MATESPDQHVGLSSADERVRKEKEVLYLRYKLQKGLLSRVYEPNEEEMEQMSEFLSKLERYPDLECSIIRATKINKVLKYILILREIPRDSEFQIRSRSRALLEKYAETLATDDQSAALLPPIQSSLQRMNLHSPDVVDDWVLVILAEEDNVVMKEGVVTAL